MKRSCKACILTVVAFLATGTFAKPLLNVLKISSSAETSLLPKKVRQFRIGFGGYFGEAGQTISFEVTPPTGYR